MHLKDFERLCKSQFIADLSRWENALDPRFIEKARREILEANGGRPPRVLDPSSSPKMVGAFAVLPALAPDE